jgi:hypothetical protein
LGAYELPAAGGDQPSSGGAGPSGDGAGPSGDGAGQPSSAPLDVTAPLISGFRATRAPRGPRFRYTIGEQAKVTLKIQRAVSGSRTGYRTIGSLSRSAAGGPNAIRLSPRLRKPVLRPGSYCAVISATDATGNHPTRRTARFRVVRG